MEKPATLKMDLTIPTTVETIDGFVDMDEKALLDYRKSLGLAMSEADIIFCQKYFRDTEREILQLQKSE